MEAASNELALGGLLTLFAVLLRVCNVIVVYSKAPACCIHNPVPRGSHALADLGHHSFENVGFLFARLGGFVDVHLAALSVNCYYRRIFRRYRLLLLLGSLSSGISEYQD